MKYIYEEDKTYFWNYLHQPSVDYGQHQGCQTAAQILYNQVENEEEKTENLPGAETNIGHCVPN